MTYHFISVMTFGLFNCLGGFNRLIGVYVSFTVFYAAVILASKTYMVQ